MWRLVTVLAVVAAVFCGVAGAALAAGALDGLGLNLSKLVSALQTPTTTGQPPPPSTTAPPSMTTDVTTTPPTGTPTQTTTQVPGEETTTGSPTQTSDGGALDTGADEDDPAGSPGDPGGGVLPGSGAGAGDSAAGTTSGRSDTIPFTGLPLLPFLLAGAALLAVGGGMRWRLQR